MARVVSLANQKGGVGKTTTAINLAAALGLQKERVLMVDVDPQGNATSGLGITKRNLENSTYDLLVGNKIFKEVVLETEYKNVDILPSNINLAGVEIELVEMDERSYRLKKALEPAMSIYDYIIIDCPPSLGLITINAFTASNDILVPIQCEYYALEGLSQLRETVRQVSRAYNNDLKIEGVILTMYDSRLNLTNQVAEEVEKFFPNQIYKTVIPRNVRLAEAPSYSMPIQYYKPVSKGANAYNKLAKEFVRRQKER